MTNFSISYNVPVTGGVTYSLMCIAVDLVYTMQPATQADTEGTLLTEKLSLYVPWIIQGYSNKTAVSTHHELMQNTKFLLEENMTLGNEKE